MSSALPTSHAPLHRLRDEVRERVRSGQQGVALSLLSAHPNLAKDSESAAELIADEFIARREKGEEPDPRLWLLVHRQWGSSLRRRFVSLGVLPTGEDSVETDARPRPGAASRELPPLPPHEKVAFLKRGGMGKVYEARELALDRVVAMKTLDSGPLATRSERLRFCREAQAAGSLDHPNILKVYALGTFEGEDCFTMPLCQGGSLAERLARGRLEAREAAALLERIAQAVHHAHERGIVHRDLKPGNVLFANDPSQPLVADFGLAKRDDSDGLTRSGAVMGTMAYMSPEQAAGRKDVGKATDIWALGVMLHEAVVGARPTGRSGQASREAVSLAMPPGLRAIVLRCLAAQPVDRFASAGGLADALAEWLDGDPMPVEPPPPPGRKRLGLAALAALAAPLLAGSALLAPSPEPEPTSKQGWLRWVSKELKAGRPVTLVGPTGHPRWYEWRTHSNRTGLEERAGPTRFTGFDVTQLELLDHMPVASYAVEAQVAFLNCPPEAVAGLYVFGAEEPCGPSREFNCYRVGYTWKSSRGPEPKTGPSHYLPAAPSVPRLHFPEDRPTSTPSPLLVAAACLGQAPASGFGAAMGIEACLSHLRPAAFHSLGFKVFSAGIAVTFDGVPIDSETHAGLAEFLRGYSMMLDIARRPVGGRPKPVFPVRGRLGVFLTKGTALFRNVRLIPILDPK